MQGGSLLSVPSRHSRQYVFPVQSLDAIVTVAVTLLGECSPIASITAPLVISSERRTGARGAPFLAERRAAQGMQCIAMFPRTANLALAAGLLLVGCAGQAAAAQAVVRSDIIVDNDPYKPFIEYSSQAQKNVLKGSFGKETIFWAMSGRRPRNGNEQQFLALLNWSIVYKDTHLRFYREVDDENGQELVTSDLSGGAHSCYPDHRCIYSEQGTTALDLSALARAATASEYSVKVFGKDRDSFVIQIPGKLISALLAKMDVRVKQSE